MRHALAALLVLVWDRPFQSDPIYNLNQLVELALLPPWTRPWLLWFSVSHLVNLPVIPTGTPILWTDRGIKLEAEAFLAVIVFAG